MSTDEHPGAEGFVERWSRRKAEASRAAAEPPQPQARPQPGPPPELPPIDKLTLESDFRGFFHPQVDEKLRRAALRKLFSEPRFNVMDGLDVYIDDYSKPDPIPPAMLAALRQAADILNPDRAAEAEGVPPPDPDVAPGQEAQAALPPPDAPSPSAEDGSEAAPAPGPAPARTA